uniref:Uncharacterized protein n=1 Tax=Rhizophora mucronata TaxID=61149 RepID=A0A2P2KF14_RHIMU
MPFFQHFLLQKVSQWEEQL